MRRRSVSSCVSPGPRSPMPPVCRSRWVQPRTRRVDRCSSCASSTCSLPSALCARCAKMSRISAVRSTTRQSRARSRLRCCAPESAWSKMTRSDCVAVRSAAISSTLPLPANSAGSGFLRRAVITPATSAPALCASAVSSERRSAGSPSPRSSSTSTARSLPSGRSSIGGCPQHVHCRRRRHQRIKRRGRCRAPAW